MAATHADLQILRDEILGLIKQEVDSALTSMDSEYQKKQETYTKAIDASLINLRNDLQKSIARPLGRRATRSRL